MFRFLNNIWEESNDTEGLRLHGHIVKAYTYRCVPMGTKFGVMAMVKNCHNIRYCKKLYENKISPISKDQLYNLVVTAVGSYIGSFILGL